MSKKPEISVLMPTYNDSKYIPAAIQSVLSQSLESWELLVIDNGSTDNTPDIVKQFAEDDKRIEYLREKRTGQLNALHYGAQFIQGNYVSILHSDDELLDDRVLERNRSMLRNSGYDGVFSDIIKMDARGQIYRTAKVAEKLDYSSPALLFLRGGSNIIPDIFFVRKVAFENVLSSYVVWNMPYWIRFEESQIGTLKLKKIEPWYKYRVYSENYIRSEVGKFEIANGCLRTTIEISKSIDLPFLKIQGLLARIFKTLYKPLFKQNQCSPRKLRQTINSVLNNLFAEIPENVYFRGLLGFYDNFPSSRTIDLHLKEDDEIFLGKDARLFFTLIEKNKIPTIYVYLLEEAAKGFGNIIVKDREDCKKAENIMRFLNLFTKIRIR